MLKTVNARRDGLSSIIISLQVVSGLAQDRGARVGVSNLANLTTTVSGLLQYGPSQPKTSIDSLGALSANLANNSGDVEKFLTNLPTSSMRWDEPRPTGHG